jgi:hypothetical protein
MRNESGAAGTTLHLVITRSSVRDDFLKIGALSFKIVPYLER